MYATTILSLFSCFETISFVADECSITELLYKYLYNRALVDDDVFDDEVRYRQSGYYSKNPSHNDSPGRVPVSTVDRRVKHRHNVQGTALKQKSSN